MTNDAAAASLALTSTVRHAQTRAEALDLVLDACRLVAPYDNAVISERSGRCVLRDVDAEAAEIVEICDAHFDRYRDDTALGLERASIHGGFLDEEVYGARRQRLAFYREIVAPQRIACFIYLLPRFRGAPLGNIRLQRGRGSPFSLDETEGVLRLLPAVELVMGAFCVDAPPLSDELASLGAREREAAGLVARGLTTGEIAQLMGTSPHTVRNQLRSVFRKTGVTNRAELAALVARTEGL